MYSSFELLNSFKMKSVLLILGSMFAMLAYFPLAKLIKKDPKGYSFASFMLWAILDVICMISIYLEGNLTYILSLVFVLGSGYIAYMLYKLKQRTWGKSENVICFLIIICLYVYYTSGNIGATIAATTATVLAGVPQVIAIWKNPDRKALPIWFLFATGSSLIFLSASGWDFENFISGRIFPLANGSMAILLFFISATKPLRSKIFYNFFT